MLIDKLGELTKDQMDDFFDSTKLNDRQRMCWAYQTETRVRLAKLEARETFNEISDTLDSKYLFEIYPKIVGEDDDKKMTAKQKSKEEIEFEKHLEAFQRKSHPAFHILRAPDESFKEIETLDMSKHKYNVSNNHLSLDSTWRRWRNLPEIAEAVPPNLLFFRIILNSYIGYECHSFHSTDPASSRYAVMGGALVAALTAWRDEQIIGAFHFSELETFLLEGKAKEYFDEYRKVSLELNQWFMNSKRFNDGDEEEEWQGRLNSCFSTGDVDLFFQAPPIDRLIFRKLINYGFDSIVMNLIQGTY